MIYRKCFKGSDEWKEISYDDALHTLLGSYKDNDEVRSLLNGNNMIPCAFSFIEAIDDNATARVEG